MDIEKCIQILRNGITVDEREAKAICKQTVEILAKEDQVIRIAPPVTVCGDIHGQFYDVMQLFKVGGNIPSVKYL